jgi:GNAT superfamily N-acetyltransferase
MLTYRMADDYEDFVQQCDLLRQMNYLEVSAKRGDGYNFSNELYDSLGDGLRIVIAYNEEKMPVGYHIAVVTPNPHDILSMLAVSDMFYLHPDYRKGLAGVELLKVAQVDLEEYAPGARWRTACPIDGERDFGVLLERSLGFVPVERVYEKVLEPEADA